MSKKLTQAEKDAKKAASADAKAAKKEAADKAKADKKANRAKLVRKSAPFRKYGASPAGHFADSMAALQNRLVAMGKKVARWNETVPKMIAEMVGTVEKPGPVEKLRAEFETMAVAGFKPKKGGAKKLRGFKPLTIVRISAEGLTELQKDFPELTPEHVIMTTHKAEETDTRISLCCFDSKCEDNEGQFLGRLSYKCVSLPPAPAVEAPAADESEAA